MKIDKYSYLQTNKNIIKSLLKIIELSATGPLVKLLKILRPINSLNS